MLIVTAELHTYPYPLQTTEPEGTMFYSTKSTVGIFYLTC